MAVNVISCDRFLDCALDQTASLLDVHEAIEDLDMRWRILARRDDVPATWDDQVRADLRVLRHYISSQLCGMRVCNGRLERQLQIESAKSTTPG